MSRHAEAHRRAHGGRAARTSAHVHSVYRSRFLAASTKLRAANKAEYERAGAKLTYMSFIAQGRRRRAPASSRSSTPRSTARTSSIKRDINLGIAVALDCGPHRAGHQARRRAEPARPQPRRSPTWPTARAARSSSRTTCRAGRSRSPTRACSARCWGCRSSTSRRSPSSASAASRSGPSSSTMRLRSGRWLSDARLRPPADRRRVADEFMSQLKQRLEALRRSMADDRPPARGLRRRLGRWRSYAEALAAPARAGRGAARGRDRGHAAAARAPARAHARRADRRRPLAHPRVRRRARRARASRCTKPAAAAT